jgi:hypothetical protein
MSYDLPNRKYAPLWSKYRPVILKMMIDSLQEPQQYQLMRHEFQALDEGKKKSIGFSLQVFKNKALNDIKTSEVAQDLLHMLLQSRKGIELMDSNTFEISLDRQLILHVSKAA